MNARETFSLVELARRLENLIRRGTIEQVDCAAEPPVARVRLRDGLKTDWLPWLPKRAAGNRSWDPIEVGEAVIVLAESGDLANGVILPSMYTQSAQAPSRDPNKAVYRFADGAVIEYDRAEHRLDAFIPGDANVQTAGAVQFTAGGAIIATSATGITLAAPSITLDTPRVRSTHNMEVVGEITDHCDDEPHTMSGMRAIYDDHKHITNAVGALTTIPDELMGEG